MPFLICIKDVFSKFLYLVKYNFSDKVNVISINDSNALGCDSRIQCRAYMCVDENYLIHRDSFVLGCKFNNHNVMLTSHFFLGEMNFMGITCYPSFQEWVKNFGNINYAFIKRYFCYSAFRNQVMAMF